MGSVSIIDIFDPRGRVSRKGLALIAAMLAASQTGAYAAMAALETPLNTPSSYVIHSLLAWAAMAAICKRLHDFGIGVRAVGAAAAGYMLWSVVVTFAVVGALGEDAFVSGGTGLVLVIAGNGLPLIGFILWLHCAAGQSGSNRFGPAPGPSGFARPHASLPAASLSPSRINS